MTNTTVNTNYASEIFAIIPANFTITYARFDNTYILSGCDDERNAEFEMVHTGPCTKEQILNWATRSVEKIKALQNA